MFQISFRKEESFVVGRTERKNFHHFSGCLQKAERKEKERRKSLSRGAKGKKFLVIANNFSLTKYKRRNRLKFMFSLLEECVIFSVRVQPIYWITATKSNFSVRLPFSRSKIHKVSLKQENFNDRKNLRRAFLLIFCLLRSHVNRYHKENFSFVLAVNRIGQQCGTERELCKRKGKSLRQCCRGICLKETIKHKYSGKYDIIVSDIDSKEE